jgi:hypothetical protein
MDWMLSPGATNTKDQKTKQNGKTSHIRIHIGPIHSNFSQAISFYKGSQIPISRRIEARTKPVDLFAPHNLSLLIQNGREGFKTAINRRENQSDVRTVRFSDAS